MIGSHRYKMNAKAKGKHPYHEVLGRGFRCMYCDAPPEELKVLDSRATLKEGFIMKRRTRHCRICDRRYSTYEINHEDLKRLMKTHDALRTFAEYLNKEFFK